MRCRSSSASARGAAARPAARRSCRARPRSRPARSAQRRLAREELDAGLLGGEARGEARGAARAVAGVGELLRGEELARDPPAGVSREQPLDARDLDGVDAAAVGPASGVASSRGRRASAPREPPARRWSPRSRGRGPARRRCAGACGARRHGRPAQSGSSASSVAMPGTIAAAQRREREHRLEDAGGGDQVAERPLERGHRRQRGAEHAAERRGLGSVGLPACRCRARRSCRRRRRRCRASASACSIARATPSPSSRIASRPSRFAGVAAAQDFAQHRRAARRGRGLGLEHQRAGAFAEQAAVVPRVERPQRLAGEQAEPVVVEHHLRLDRRVVADRDGAVGLARGAAPPSPR